MTVGFRLSPQQRLLWRLHGPTAGPFTGRSVLLVRGELDVDTLRESVRRVVARHEILRTAFSEPVGVGEPVQVVREPGDVDFRVESARDADGIDLGIDVRGGSPLQVCVVRNGGAEHRVEI
ncbi:MAG TPA: condensation domain-containing protein, partial [bacterium]|nr:condensation domain-containing protein [bacterium]